ncbi:unnamed protein product [Peniophora sp. CBMAI 1063]|nr:unnamed protein product [Peniophora sp. CBMAI 1063]
MAITLSSWQRLSFFAPKRRGSQSKASPSPVAALDEKDAQEPRMGYAVSETSAATAKLSSEQRAAFAVTSRLLASFVTEALLRAIYIPSEAEDYAGLCVIFASVKPSSSGAKTVAGIFAVVPVHHVPILKEDNAVWLLDPLDMLPNILFFGDEAGELCEEFQRRNIATCLRAAHWTVDDASSLRTTLSPRFWWTRFAEDAAMEVSMRDTLLEEIASSFMWQKAIYDRLPFLPALGASAIEWEQSLVEGHPTHPMHRARRTLPPLQPLTPATRDWYRPKVRFAVVSRSRVDIRGDFEARILDLVKVAAAHTGASLPEIPPDRLIMPVYDLQVANIEDKFPDVQILPESISIQTQAQASLRTITIPGFSFALKLAVGIKVSSALRTISHYTANVGPRLSEEIVPKLAVDPEVLYIERETGSAVCMRDMDGNTVDEDIAKHFTAVLRDPYVPKEDEAVVLVAALGETGHANSPAGVSAAQQILGLDTREKRVSFFDEYTRLLVDAVVPPMLHNGLAFEAHPQNTLVRLSRSTKRVRGFVMRDLGGLRVHAETLRASTGTDFQFLPGHCVVTASVEEAAKKLYHTLVFNHLQRLARSLGLHHDGSGWGLLRKHLEAKIPRDSWLWNVWLSEDGAHSVSGKCLLRMKLAGLYRDSVYEPFPNLIQYRPS